MKQAGDGSITKVRSGRFWVRSPMKADGTRPGLGTFATLEEAQEELETARAMLGRATEEALTFAKLAAMSGA